MKDVRTLLKVAMNTLFAMVREIFDESAYQRFLDRKQLASSPQAYAAFIREARSGRRLKCC